MTDRTVGGPFVVIEGQEYPVALSDREWVLVEPGRGDPWDVPGVIEVVDNWRGPCARVAKSGLQRYFSRGVAAWWQGEYVGVSHVLDDEIAFVMARDVSRPRELGFVGEQREGFTAWAPWDEVEVAWIDESDIGQGKPGVGWPVQVSMRRVLRPPTAAVELVVPAGWVPPDDSRVPGVEACPSVTPTLSVPEGSELFEVRYRPMHGPERLQRVAVLQGGVWVPVEPGPDWSDEKDYWV